MIKFVLKTALIFLLSFSVYSQSSYLKVGENYSKFGFRNELGTNVQLQPKWGTSLEVGFSKPFGFTQRFSYDLSLHLDDYNFYVPEPAAEVDYSTKYLGIENALVYSIIGSSNTGKDSFFVNLKMGFTVSKMVTGIERIQGKLYDLKQFPEFSGVFLSNSLGLSTKYGMSDYSQLSVGYDYCFSFLNTGDVGEQSLSFRSNQFKVGIYFLIN